jgi:hypothetical protein
MGRAYAAVLGPLAFAMIVAKGLLTGASVEGTCAAASAGLFLFAAAGYVIGQGAELLVNESVRRQFQAAMEQWDAKHASDKQNNKTQQKNG